MVYDAILAFALVFCVGMVYTAIAIALSGGPDPALLDAKTGDVITELQPVELGWPIYPLLISTAAGFYVFFWHRNGQTLGMRAWKIKLIANRSSQPHFHQYLLRLFFSIISFLAFGAGYFYMLVDPQRRTLHDILSDTSVVYLSS
jgi:uncharacterized RDD family membrane protein YckC